MVKTELKKHSFLSIIKHEIHVNMISDLGDRICFGLGFCLAKALETRDFEYGDLKVIASMGSYIYLSDAKGYHELTPSNSSQYQLFTDHKQFRGYVAGIPVYIDYARTDNDVLRIYDKDKQIIEIKWQLPQL